MNEWISVKDRLPEEGIKVLSVNTDNQLKIDYIVDFQTEKIWAIWACTLDREQNTVTHWMPLPKPPNL